MRAGGVVPVTTATKDAVVSDRFDDFFERHRDELLGLAWRVLGDRAEAEDAVQEAFLKLSTHPVLERTDCDVAAWLRRVCVNDSFNRLRGRKRASERHDRAGRMQRRTDGDGDSPVAAAVLRREARDEVRRVLAALPERQRACLLLRHSGYRYAEIAATLDLAVGSVGVLLARAERAFRTAYAKEAGERPANRSNTGSAASTAAASYQEYDDEDLS